MDPALEAAAVAARGFMPSDEGRGLHEFALRARGDYPWVEIGSYCGKSTIYLGAAARARGTILYSVDHHRGSEEHQLGEEYHDAALADGAGRIDTLPEFARTIRNAGLEGAVQGLAADSATLAAAWRSPLALVFIDGGHSPAAAHADYEGWAPHLILEGTLLIHDVFPDPADGGRPPYEIYSRALESAAFVEVGQQSSLRALQRVGDGI